MITKFARLEFELFTTLPNSDFLRCHLMIFYEFVNKDGSQVTKHGLRPKLLNFSVFQLFIFIFCVSIFIFHIPSPAISSEAAVNQPSPIVYIEVVGLYSIFEDELLYLLNISIGEALDKAKLRAGIKRSFLSGIFDDIIIESLDDANSMIKVTAIEKRIIDSVKITGNDYFSSRFIKRHLRVSKGTRLKIFEVEMAVKSLENELRKRGFPDANVTYSIIPEKDNRADIVINVVEGEPDIIKKILISEPEYVVRDHIRLSEGDVFDSTEMERLTKKVINYYRKLRYIGTTLSYSYSNGILDIKLSTGMNLNILLKGNVEISNRKLMREMPFFELNEFSRDLVEMTTARMIELYRHYGHPFAQITPTISISDDNILLEFSILEGDRYLVNSIVFASVIEHLIVPQERLKDILALKIGGYYNPDLLKSDMITIKEFYHALGYLHMEIQKPDVKMDNGKVEIKFYIKEGPQVKLSKISIKNNINLSDDEILEKIPLKLKEPYNELNILDARRKILDMYSVRGFLDATVTITREISDASANITFNIQEGDVTLFGKTVIVGNERTKRKVIKRELLHKKGYPIDYRLIIEERRRLYRLGLFEDVEVILSDKKNNKRDVLYKLKELPAGAVEFGFGYGEYERYRGFFGISHRNLWGMNRQVSFKTELSTLRQRFVLSYVEPWFLGREIPLTSIFLHEHRKQKDIDTGETRYRLRRNSISIGIERRFNETLRAELYYDFSRVRTFDVKPDIVLSRQDIDALTISSIRPGLIYDTRDNPIDPKSGVLAGLSLSIASDILFSETDFIKLTAYASKYQSLSRAAVLAVSVRGGGAQGFRETRDLPIVERFFLGGGATVRGYKQDSLGPKGIDGTPKGGNAFMMANLELRADIWRGLGIVAFADGGNVWGRIDDMDITNLKYTVGLGLRYDTPVGPIRIDYGHKLDRKEGESRGAIHFSIGHAF